MAALTGEALYLYLTGVRNLLNQFLILRCFAALYTAWLSHPDCLRVAQSEAENAGLEAFAFHLVLFRSGISILFLSAVQISEANMSYRNFASCEYGYRPGYRPAYQNCHNNCFESNYSMCWNDRAMDRPEQESFGGHHADFS